MQSVYYDLNALAHTLTAFVPHVSGNYTITYGYGIIMKYPLLCTDPKIMNNICGDGETICPVIALCYKSKCKICQITQQGIKAFGQNADFLEK